MGIPLNRSGPSSERCRNECCLPGRFSRYTRRVASVPCETFEMSNLPKVAVLFLTVYISSAALGSSETAFEILKGLQGKWAIQSEGRTLPIQMSYEVNSNGSIVTEQFGRELSVFYRDGRNLQMIHFCNAGNQPRLRLKESSRQGLLTFETFDITNLKSTDSASRRKDYLQDD